MQSEQDIYRRLQPTESQEFSRSFLIFILI
jgi:hypothetical protein